MLWLDFNDKCIPNFLQLVVYQSRLESVRWETKLNIFTEFVIFLTCCVFDFEPTS